MSLSGIPLPNFHRLVYHFLSGAKILLSTLRGRIYPRTGEDRRGKGRRKDRSDEGAVSGDLHQESTCPVRNPRPYRGPGLPASASYGGLRRRSAGWTGGPHPHDQSDDRDAWLPLRVSFAQCSAFSTRSNYFSQEALRQADRSHMTCWQCDPLHSVVAGRPRRMWVHIQVEQT